MAQPPDRHTDLKKAGLAAALAVALLLAAGLSVVVFTRRHAPRPTPPADETARREVPPDIAETGMQTERARVQFADKQDPGRAAGMIEWARLEPISQMEKRLTEPRGYVYMRDGGLVVVSSRTGRLNTMPKSQEPQSGRFEGGVTLQLFPAGTDPKADPPTLTAKSDSLDFDLPSASASTAGHFTVNSTSIDIDGSGMRLVANQVEEGIERFEVAHVNSVVIRPDARDPVQSKGLTGTQPARATPGSVRGPDHRRTYRAVIDGAVRIAQAGRVMTAERAEAWAHLLNNRLEPGAIGRFGPDPSLTGSCPDTGDPNNAVLSAPPAATVAEKNPAPPAPPMPPSPADSTITATWTGRMVVTPVAGTGEGAQPPELDGNKVGLRLHAGGAQQPVRVSDSSMKGVFTAARVDVGATRREFALTASPLIPVHVETAGAGWLECPRAVVKLGEGLIALDGPGVLWPSALAVAKGPLPGTAPEAAPGAAPAAAPPPATTLSFAKALVLKFATVGNWITPDARSGRITGGFRAVSGGVEAAADEATVIFNPRVNDRNTIRELTLAGHALASAPSAQRSAAVAHAGEARPPVAPGSRDTLGGERMVFAFADDPKTGRETPAGVEVTGDAQATSGGAADGQGGLTLKARSIGAQLGKQGDQVAVVGATARDEVQVSTRPRPGESPITATADRLDVDPAQGLAVLQGMGGSVTVSGNGAVMIGKKVTLSQSDNSVFVDGAGTLASISEDADPAGQRSSTATWKTSMAFNNTTGVATCIGDAAATMTVGETERNIASAETIVLTFTPGGAGATPGAGAAKSPAGPGVAARELLTAEAIGELGMDRRPPRPATLERRVFSSVNGAQRLDQLVFLQAQQIIANQPRRTLDVPVPGKLLVDDRTAEPAPSPPTAPAVDQPATETSPAGPLGGFTSSKGASLFMWSGGLHLDMVAGRVQLTKDVQLTHQPLAVEGQPAPPQTTVDCDRLTAFLRPQEAVGADPAAAPVNVSATLTKVEAAGSVVARSEGRQLTAETIAFDTIAQVLDAAGGNGPDPADQTLVSFLDPARPTPLRARRIVWNQRTGEARIIEPAPASIGQ